MANQELTAEEPATAPRQTADDDRRRRWPWVVAVVSAVVVIGTLVYPGVIRGFIFPSTFQGRQGTAAAPQQAVGTTGRIATGGGRGGAGGPRAVPVAVARAHVGNMPVYLTGLGTVVAADTVTIRPRVDGQLIKVAFREGQLVQQGELLAEIDPRPYLVQLTQAQGQAAKDEAALKNAQLDLERYRVLFAQDAIPKQQLDTQAATVNQFEGPLKSDQGAIDAARLNLVYTRITAPFAGRVGLRQVDAGNMVHAADQNGIVVLTRVRPIIVLFNLPADTLPQVLQPVHAGRKLPVEAWDRDLTSRLATGSLLSTDNEIDSNTGTYRLKGEFANEHDELFPNQFVNARLLVNTLQSAVIVPTAAIQRSPQGTFVWVVGPGDKVEMRPCDVQLSEADQSVIARGISDGETVVTDGVDRLQQGIKVQARAEPGAPTGRGGSRQPSGPQAPGQPPGRMGSGKPR